MNVDIVRSYGFAAGISNIGLAPIDEFCVLEVLNKSSIGLVCDHYCNTANRMVHCFSHCCLH
ncbi:unnamed protein product [Meloidogyne enterolobii]|uniref:Uncharacterized protein n=1 Tax=Meloidogyne enterolobii TaxID=390850 RepID=A0ACB0XYJ1_MELEN